MKIHKKYAFAAISGAMLGLSFPPLPFPLLAFVAFVPLLTAFELEGNKQRKWSVVYIMFSLYNGIANWWIGSWRSESDPYLMASGIAVWLAHPFFFYLPFAAYFYIRRKLGTSSALAALPFLWITFEWLHSLGDMAFPWLTVGNTQILNLYWIQFIDITGVWGSSFLILTTNSLVAAILLAVLKKPVNIKPVKYILNEKWLISKVVLVALILIVPYIYGFIRLAGYDHQRLLVENKRINVGLIQPNVNPWRKWDSPVLRQIGLHRRLQDSLTATVVKLNLCIWSETAIAYISPYFNSGKGLTILQSWLDTCGTALLTGFAEFYVYKPGDEVPSTASRFPDDPTKRYDAFNAAVLLNPKPYSTESFDFYRKIRLTPFSERIPYLEYFGFARRWLEWSVGISAWGKGTDQRNLNLIKNGDTIKIGTVICIESIYPGYVRNFVASGARMLSVITNDGWYDYTYGPEQHWLIAAVRAIETRRYIARCANTGITGVIRPTGDALLRAPEYKSVGVAATVPLLSEETIYVRLGDWLVYVCLVASLGFIISSIFLSKKHLS